ncbi:hypothetical protein ACFORO_20045 [Amycolatopsis halotolerans]|uniref:Rx N-terminal domain-containing protein n=1 Tax=Amycolatopsis halotolerans TaxID=330083 RepID=A0ABV7QH79_9PSEU
MDAEIVALINSGVTSLLGLMVKDAWERSKKSAASLFSTDKKVISAIESELDETSDRLKFALSSGDTEAEAEVAAEWRSRLRRAVCSDDSLLVALRAFVEENKNSEEGCNRHYGKVAMKAKARDSSRVYQQGSGTQYNH